MAVQEQLASTDYPAEFEEQLLVLDGLMKVAAIHDQPLLRDRFIQQTVHADQVDLQRVLYDLNLVPHTNSAIDLKTANGRKVMGREYNILKKAYPNSPHDSYNGSYIHEMFGIMPNLLDIKATHNPYLHAQTHKERLGLWLSGLSLNETAKQSSTSPKDISGWLDSFPKKLADEISFYELAQAADYVERAMACAYIGHTATQFVKNQVE